MNVKTYNNQGGLSHLPQTLREFGERQNKLNAELRRENESLTHQLETLAGHLGDALDRIKALESQLERITALESEQETNIKRFHRCAVDLDKIEQEVGRLKLTAKLNTNAIDRLSRQSDSGENGDT